MKSWSVSSQSGPSDVRSCHLKMGVVRISPLVRRTSPRRRPWWAPFQNHKPGLGRWIEISPTLGSSGSTHPRVSLSPSSGGALPSPSGRLPPSPPTQPPSGYAATAPWRPCSSSLRGHDALAVNSFLAPGRQALPPCSQLMQLPHAPTHCAVNPWCHPQVQSPPQQLIIHVRDVCDLVWSMCIIKCWKL